jgi:membrane protein required for colicin V production
METPPVNLTDVVVVLVILISGLFAFFRGLVHEVLAVISWLGAAMATLFGFPYAQPYAAQLITVPLIADMAAGVTIFLIALIVLSILTRIVSARIRNSALGPLDRSLGLIFGFLRGAVVVAVAWLVFAWLLPREDHPKWITEAKLRPLVEQSSVLLVSLLPERLRGEIGAQSGAARDDFEELRRLEQEYQNLLNPPAKGDAPPAEPGYNSRERDEMRRAIEGIGGSDEESQ